MGRGGQPRSARFRTGAISLLGIGSLLVMMTLLPPPATAAEAVPLCHPAQCGWKTAGMPENLTESETPVNALELYQGAIIGVGGNGTILRSTNLGRNFSWVDSPVLGTTLTTLTLNPYGQLIAGGRDGTLVESSNDGVTWDVLPSRGLQGNSTSLGFLTSTFGFDATDDGLYFSSDGGSTWVLDGSLGPGWARSAAFYNDQDGWVDFGVNPTVYYTQDGGASWTAGIFNDTPAIVSQFTPFGPSSAWGVDRDGSVFKTTNGLNWTRISVPIGQLASGLSVVNNTDIWESAAEGNVFYSPNGGSCWTEEPVPNIPDFDAVTFWNSKDGVIAGAGQIFYTTDAGIGTMYALSPLSSLQPGRGLSSAVPIPGDPDDYGPTGPCAGPPPNVAPYVLGTAMGIGIGAAILAAVRYPGRPQDQGEPAISEEEAHSRPVKRQGARVRYKSRRRYIRT